MLPFILLFCSEAGFKPQRRAHSPSAYGADLAVINRNGTLFSFPRHASRGERGQGRLLWAEGWVKGLIASQTCAGSKGKKERKSIKPLIAASQNNLSLPVISFCWILILFTEKKKVPDLNFSNQLIFHQPCPRSASVWGGQLQWDGSLGARSSDRGLVSGNSDLGSQTTLSQKCWGRVPAGSPCL